jgi:thiamine-phosphate diphosphorylase
MPLPFRLQLIVDRPRSEREIEPLLGAGVDCLHIRIRDGTTRALVDYSTRIVELAHAWGVKVLVNGRLDVALAVQADGVQLPSHGVPVAAARKLLPDRLVCASVHSEAEAAVADSAGADLVTFGHVFASASHSGDPPRGVQQLQRVVVAVTCPVVAIGGISPVTIDEVVASGVRAVAVIGTIWNSPEPGMVVKELRERLDT